MNLPHGYNSGTDDPFAYSGDTKLVELDLQEGETPGAEGRPAAPLQPRHLAQLPSTCREAGHLPVDWRTYQVVQLNLMVPCPFGHLTLQRS